MTDLTSRVGQSPTLHDDTSLAEVIHHTEPKLKRLLTCIRPTYEYSKHAARVEPKHCATRNLRLYCGAAGPGESPTDIRALLLRRLLMSTSERLHEDQTLRHTQLTFSTLQLRGSKPGAEPN